MSRPNIKSAFMKPGQQQNTESMHSDVIIPQSVPAPKAKASEEQLNVVIGVDRKRQLKALAANEGRSMLSLTNEALNILFRMYNLPEIND